MAKQFAVVDEADGKVTIRFHGSLTEDNKKDLSAIKITAKSAILDFTNLTFINSSGIREWTNWMKTVKTKFTFENCPPAVVDTMNLVADFYEGHQVGSILMDFVCDSCDSEQRHLVRLENDVAAGPQLTQDYICSKCGEDMRPVVELADSLAFLVD